MNSGDGAIALVRRATALDMGMRPRLNWAEPEVIMCQVCLAVMQRGDTCVDYGAGVAHPWCADVDRGRHEGSEHERGRD